MVNKCHIHNETPYSLLGKCVVTNGLEQDI